MIYLIILLEAKELSALSEASSADVEAILADDTTTSLADSASSLEGSRSIASWMCWNEINWHELPKKPTDPVSAQKVAKTLTSDT